MSSIVYPGVFSGRQVDEAIRGGLGGGIRDIVNVVRENANRAERCRPKAYTVTIPAGLSPANSWSLDFTDILTSDTAQRVIVTPTLSSQSDYYRAGVSWGVENKTLIFISDSYTSTEITVYVIVQEVNATWS